MDIETQVSELVEGLLAGSDTELLEVSNAGGTLRVTLDRAGGLDLDRIAEHTRSISRALDAEDPRSGRYTLEVSSPGLERRLRTPSQFGRAVGETVSITTRGAEPSHDDGALPERVSGELVGASDDRVVVQTEDGEEVSLAYDRIAKARTTFAWGAAAKTNTSAKSGKGDNSPGAKSSGKGSKRSEVDKEAVRP